MKESPLFVNTYNLLLWLVPQVLKFPRKHRFGIGERIQRLALDFQDSLVAAAKHKGADRTEKLILADVQLQQLRTWVRFARDNELISVRQYEHVSHLIADVGGPLGAWLKRQQQGTPVS